MRLKIKAETIPMITEPKRKTTLSMMLSQISFLRGGFEYDYSEKEREREQNGNTKFINTMITCFL